MGKHTIRIVEHMGREEVEVLLDGKHFRLFQRPLLETVLLAVLEAVLPGLTIERTMEED